MRKIIHTRILILILCVLIIPGLITAFTSNRLGNIQRDYVYSVQLPNKDVFPQSSSDSCVTKVWQNNLSGYFGSTFGISGDGEYYSLTRDNTLYLFNKSSPIPEWSSPTSGNLELSRMSDDGNFIVAGGNRVLYYDRSNPVPIINYTVGDSVSAADVSANGEYFVVGTDINDHRVLLFSNTSSTPLWTINTESRVNWIDMTPDGMYFVVACNNSYFYYFNRISSTPMWSYYWGGSYSAISDNGQYILMATDNIVLILNQTGGFINFVFTESKIMMVDISSDGEYYATVEQDTNLITFFDKDKDDSLWEYQANDSVVSCRFSQNGDYLIVGSLDNHVYLFNKTGSYTPMSILDLESDVLFADIATDGGHFAAVTESTGFWVFENEKPYLPFNITNPDCNSLWEYGSTYSINWESNSSLISLINIELYRLNDYKYHTIASGIPNSGSYSWLIPSNISEYQAYRIKISDHSNSSAYSLSPYFEILHKYIEVILPYGDQKFIRNIDEMIWWDYRGNITTVNIDLYESGLFVESIVAGTPNNGIYLWKVDPDLPDSRYYRIRVTDAMDPTISDYSDNFEIGDKTITVVFPLTSSSWTAGESHEIRWLSEGPIPFIDIELYREGEFVMEIANSINNYGSLDWTLPSDLMTSTHYKIKIIDSLDPILYAISHEFEIIGKRSIPGFGTFFLIFSILAMSSVILWKLKKSVHLFQ